MDSVEGVDTTKMNREQLEIYAHKILEELEREREERNFFQIERDKLRTFWEITRQQLDEARAEIRYVSMARFVNFKQGRRHTFVQYTAQKQRTREGGTSGEARG